MAEWAIDGKCPGRSIDNPRHHSCAEHVLESSGGSGRVLQQKPACFLAPRLRPTSQGFYSLGTIGERKFQPNPVASPPSISQSIGRTSPNELPLQAKLAPRAAFCTAPGSRRRAPSILQLSLSPYPSKSQSG